MYQNPYQTILQRLKKGVTPKVYSNRSEKVFLDKKGNIILPMFIASL